ncbi:DUF488 domain-containing protein [Bacillus sp. EB106-08-02-XG196]|jgi:uncharacterized protein YeaO (DUF488 family)|uniref:DUF488 domain-containing protein n=1 Tax=Bacillus sp. EB106-08-02-XG196 TaxID=2737049 RepID=UPI0015C40FDB|nr:DUF488 domain-containing protein [Bacillus sp. EB106-08-02-XG196]NWQ40695.1 DUF488 domain-containing protein [Bacillus sp. EB106-08-02-XG196]
MGDIFLKRVYEPYDESDGFRILVDRLWPRGISKEAARLTAWQKEVAPSPELRKWFCHKPELFDEFQTKYIEELRTDEQKLRMIDELIHLTSEGNITLLYGAKDPVYNHAIVLEGELKRIINHIETKEFDT